jgi:hypothetical protein
MFKLGYKWALSLLAFLVAVALTAGTATTPAPIVVELFTSEGCSDCPAADAFLRMLDSTQPVAGAQLIVLEEHVDYWDDLGWKDPFSSHSFTVRQEEYVGRMRLASAYTPQMVVDGTYQFVGSDRRSAIKAFESDRSNVKVGVRVTSKRAENDQVLLHLETDAAPARADVVMAIAAERAETHVQRGENGGRNLEHVAILRNLTTVGKTEKGQAFSKDVTLSAKGMAQPSRVIFFLQEPNQGRILGATVEMFNSQSQTAAVAKP